MDGITIIMVTFLLQTLNLTKNITADVGIEQLMLAAFMLGLFKPKKMNQHEQPSIFMEYSQFFDREEIRSNLENFEWVPIRRQQVDDTIRDVDVVNELKHLVKKKHVSVIVLCGEGGSGKTKALHEFAREQRKNRCVFVNWNLPHLDIEHIRTEYKNLPHQTTCLILENIDLNPKKAIRFCRDLHPTKEKIILATRNLKETQKLLQEFRIENVAFFHLNKMHNLLDLLKYHSEIWLTSEVKDKIVSIADGNPEILSVIIEFIEQEREQSTEFRVVEFLQNVTNRDRLFAYIKEDIYREMGAGALELIARSVIQQGIDKSDPFCKENYKYYTTLRSLNYFYIQNNKLYFKPAILGEYITQQYFFPDGEIAPPFDNLVEDAEPHLLENIISTLIRFFKEQPVPVYKEAASFLLSSTKFKGIDSDTVVRLALCCDSGFNDAKVVLDSVEDIFELNVESSDPDLINQFAIFCAKSKAYEKAAKLWEDLLEIAREANHDGWITTSYNNLGMVYQNMEDWKNSLECYQLAYDRFKMLGITKGVIQSLNNLAQVHLKKGDWKKAIATYKSAANEYINLKDYENAARTHVKIGQICKANDELDLAIESFRQAKNEFEMVSDIMGWAQACGNLGLIYKSRDEFELAVEFYQHALIGLEQIGDIRGIGRTHNNLALVYQEMNEMEKAVQHYHQAIEKFELINDTLNLSQTLNNLALIYQYNQDWESALGFHQRAFLEKEKMGDKDEIARTLSNLGTVYHEKGQWEQAIECFRSSLKLNEAQDSEENRSQIYGNLGIAYQKNGQLDEAIEAFRTAIELMEKAGKLNDMAQTYGNLGLTYFEKKDYKRAITLFNELLFYYLKHKAGQEIRQVSGILSDFQKKMDEKEFNKIADQALNDVVKNGIRWGDQTIMTSDEAKNILTTLKKRKASRGG